MEGVVAENTEVQREKKPASSSLPVHLSQRRAHLDSLLSQHVALVDEIQRSAKVRIGAATRAQSRSHPSCPPLTLPSSPLSPVPPFHADNTTNLSSEIEPSPPQPPHLPAPSPPDLILRGGVLATPLPARPPPAQAAVHGEGDQLR